MEKPCVRCGKPVEQADTGRPRRYCGIGCRRAAEYEVRRLDRRIEKAQDEFDRLPPRDLLEMSYDGRTLKQHRLHLQEVIAASEARMRDLLDDSGQEGE